MTLRGLILLTAVPVLAHDLYLMPRHFRVPAGQTITVAFHNGDDFPQPDRPPRIQNMMEPMVATKAGKAAFHNLRVDGKVLLADVTIPESGTATLSVRSRPSLIELQPVKFEEYLKHEGLDHVIRWRAEHNETSSAGRERYSKYVKSIVTAGKPDGFFRNPAGLPIEIVPESDPAQLKPGDTLTMQIVFRGKPADGLQVEMAWLTPQGRAGRKVAGRTNGEGKLRIPIGSRGVWKLHSVLMERCQEPSVADWESFWTSLTFEVR